MELYVDCDFECIQSLDIFDYASNNNIDNKSNENESVSFILGFSNTGLLEVNNALIGCKPKHKLLIEIWKSIQLICNNNNNDDGDDHDHDDDDDDKNDKENKKKTRIQL